MFIGRYQLGKEVTYTFITTSPAKVPLAPTNAPTASVLDAAGNDVRTGLKVPSRDYPRITGLFEGRIFLNDDFAVGQYTIHITWANSGSTYTQSLVFEVMPGGRSSGQITSMINHPRPNADYIINARDSGLIFKGKNAQV